MALYTKIDKQKDNYYEAASIKKVIIKTKLSIKKFSFSTFSFQCVYDCYEFYLTYSLYYHFFA